MTVYIGQRREIIVNKNQMEKNDSSPKELEPVLAKIEHVGSLGKSVWYEVVFFDGGWKSFGSSNTFIDGDKVISWKYCKHYFTVGGE